MNHDTEEGLAGYYGGQARITYGMYSALGGYETDVGGGNTNQNKWNQNNSRSSTVMQGSNYVRGVRSEDVDGMNISSMRSIVEPDKRIYKVDFKNIAEDSALTAMKSALDNTSKKKLEVILAIENIAEEWVGGEPVSYQGGGLVKMINEYFTDEELSGMVDKSLLERLVSGKGTEDDIKEFLNVVSESPSYNEMGYLPPKEYIKAVNNSADGGLYNEAKQIETEGFPEGMSGNAGILQSTLRNEKGRQYDMINAIESEAGISPY